MKRPKLSAYSSEKLLRVACWLALVALPMMTVSIFFPTVWPVLVALSIGQGIGTLSFVLFLAVVVRDLDIVRRFRAPKA